MYLVLDRVGQTADFSGPPVREDEDVCTCKCHVIGHYINVMHSGASCCSVSPCGLPIVAGAMERHQTGCKECQKVRAKKK